MKPPAFTAGLNGRFGLPPVVMICFDDDCASVMATATETNASVASRRMGRSSKVCAIVFLTGMIEKRRSAIQGWGVFATERITKNTRIIDYAGEKISNQESLKRERRYIRRGHIWCFKLTNRTVIDAGVGGNVARYINHSCQPNAYVHIVGGVIWIRAARTIRKGEEITYNYNTDGEGLIKCRCRPGCQVLL